MNSMLCWKCSIVNLVLQGIAMYMLIEKEKETFILRFFQVSQLVLGIPVTQVSVERPFSHLKYILSDQRVFMVEELLKDV